MENETVLVHYDKKVRETDKAILYRIDKDEIWIPKSVIEEDYGDNSIEVRRWFAENEDFV